MIKSLRKKFIIVAMCSTFVVLAAIMGVINFANYHRIVERADEMTELLARNDGGFEEPPENINNPMGKKENPGVRKPEGMSAETPFSTRYFTVTLDEEGNVLSSDMGKIAAINQEKAEEYAKEVFKRGKIKDFKDIYRYRAVKAGEGIMIIFLDCSQSLDSIRSFAIISVSGSLLG